MESSGIYQIKNKKNGKLYIGSTTNFENRWRRHVQDLKYKRHHNIHLQRAWDKYGEDVFKFSIIEYVSDETELIVRENFWLNKTQSYDFDVGYNIARDASRPMRGRAHSEETILKLRKRMLGNKYSLGYKHTRESRERMRLSHLGEKNHFYQKKHSQISRQKMSDARQGMYIGEKNTSAKLTEEDVKEIKIALLEGRTQKEIANKYNVSRSNIGNIKSGRIWRHVLPDLKIETKKRLSKDDVREIRKMIGDGIKYSKIASKYGVTKSTISAINVRKIWSNLR